MRKVPANEIHSVFQIPGHLNSDSDKQKCDNDYIIV